MCVCTCLHAAGVCLCVYLGRLEGEAGDKGEGEVNTEVQGGKGEFRKFKSNIRLVVSQNQRKQ